MLCNKEECPVQIEEGFSEYSRKVLDKSKSRRVPIREQLKRAADQLAKDKPRQKERVKEATHADR